MNTQKRKTMRVSIDVKSYKAQGPRATMEDVSCIKTLDGGRIFMGVFDGHGGIEVAQMCADNAPGMMNDLMKVNPDMSECLRLLYKRLDDKALECGTHVGCTAAIAVITQDRVWFSNAGDAMIAMKLRNGNATFVSENHKVENEKERIQRLGGLVTYYDGCARIYGSLNIARSIGDHSLKAFVWSDPYVTATSCLKSNIEWILMASDGLWDVLEPNDVEEYLQESSSLNKLANDCYRRGSMDNIAIIHATFKPLVPA